MKLLEQVTQRIAVLHYSDETDKTYRHWIEQFLRYHRRRAGKWGHPDELVEKDVQDWLEHLACEQHVASVQHHPGDLHRPSNRVEC